MRSVFKVGVCLSASVLALVIVFGASVESQSGRFTEAVPGRITEAVTGGNTGGASEAATGVDGESNGFAEEFCANQNALVDSPNSPMVPASECNFDAAAEEFTGPETVSDGLGPVFNGNGCGECHISPVLGGASQIAERRAGFFNGSTFIDHPGGSLIHDRALDPRIQETVIPSRTNVFSLRASQSLLGDGYVEALSSNTLSDIAAAQPSSMRGQMIQVDVFEKPGARRTGRFGWKAQQASLVSFAADAYLNEMGITSPLQPVENTSNGNSVDDYDEVPGLDDLGVDVELFALFMRSLKAPPRGPIDADVTAGQAVFNQIGCSVCHTPSMVTAEPGTSINGGAMQVTRALGNKRIRPYGDFLLHDVGTGDGIVQNGGMSTRNKIRTAPLWGLRSRGRFMHDLESHSIEDAIQRHDNQAEGTRRAYNGLGRSDQRRVLAFLRSL